MTVVQNPVVIMAIMSWLAAPPQSLGEVAQKEAMRRQMLPKSAVAVSGSGLPGGMSSIPSQASPSSGESAPTAAAAAPANPAVEHKNDEAWWRKRMTDARKALDEDQATAATLQTRINGLQRDVVNVDNPLQQQRLRDDLTNALAELEKAKARVTNGQNAIQSIQDEARRLDVPPGWVR
ncbi:MAG TPA: hypothetical protein VFV78_01670 [Vicinamibacterales bacterium]|nr:hypothetical protein [Vicinamibacterales bacterium]